MNLLRFTLSAALLFCFFSLVAAKPPIREAPSILDGREQGIGRTIPDLQYVDLSGKIGRLSELAESKAIVVLMTGTGCPLCRKYAPSLAAIEKEYQAKGVQCVFVNPNLAEKPAKIEKNVSIHGFQGPYVRDVDHDIIRALKAKTTTESFVLDAKRKLIYRGAVDDQYGFGYSLNEPRHTYLTDALDALLSESLLEITATSAPGCELWIDDE
jgi:thiol-disulfide isomerase/thioredoxin